MLNKFNQTTDNAIVEGFEKEGWQVKGNQLPSLPKDLINKESPLSNKDLDFLNEIKPDTSVQKEPDLNNDKSIEEVDLENAKPRSR